MDDQYLDAFIRESEEAITELNNSLLDLESDPGDREAMDEIFRRAHTLKGNFGAMGFEDASNLAHAIEDLLDAMRQGEMDVTADRMDLVFAGVDQIEVIVREIDQEGESSTDTSEMVAQLRAVLEEADGTAGEAPQSGGEATDGEDETGADLVALSGNLCTDKKPAAINAVEGRGRTVTADVAVPREVVEERLHTTPGAIAELNTRKNLVGSAKAGSLGFNAHVANVVAAMFLATGQDEAQVVEGANAITTAEERDGDLYLSVSLASLEVGTVGGGTKLPTQSEALDILGIRGGGDPAGSNADALAEFIAVGALAGELSLLSALASRHLSSAHAELGR